MNEKWVVNVPVATIWTSLDSPRELDRKVVSNPIDIQGWIRSLNYETLLELCDDNLIQSQALYGEGILILEEQKEWAKVLVPSQPSSKDARGYPGWIPKCQLTKVEWNLKKGPVAIVTSKKASLFGSYEQVLLELSYLTILPVKKEEGEWIKVVTPSGIGLLKKQDITVYSSLKQQKKGTGQDIITACEQFLGLPYLWGGMSSFGYDCSGFSYTMCKANGYIIPRDAHDQSKGGRSVPLTELQPGDLLFFAYEEGKGSIHHVGIFYGDGKMIHSPKTGRCIEILTLEGTIYEKELCTASRYW